MSTSQRAYLAAGILAALAVAALVLLPLWHTPGRDDNVVGRPSIATGIVPAMASPTAARPSAAAAPTGSGTAGTLPAGTTVAAQPTVAPAANQPVAAVTSPPAAARANAAPGPITGLELAANTLSEFTLAWQPATDDAPGVRYAVAIDGSVVAITDQTSITLPWPSHDNVLVQLVAIDAQGAQGTWAALWVVPPPGVEPAGPPAPLDVTSTTSASPTQQPIPSPTASPVDTASPTPTPTPERPMLPDQVLPPIAPTALPSPAPTATASVPGTSPTPTPAPSATPSPSATPTTTATASHGAKR